MLYGSGNAIDSELEATAEWLKGVPAVREAVEKLAWIGVCRVEQRYSRPIHLEILDSKPAQLIWIMLEIGCSCYHCFQGRMKQSLLAKRP